MGKVNVSQLMLVAVLFGFLIVGVAMIYFESRSEKTILDKAILKRNPNLCSTDKFKTVCFEGVAKEFQDPVVCEGIEETYGKNLCLFTTAKIKNDLSICGKITDEIGIDLCYESLAKATKDPKICDRIVDQKYGNIKDRCYSAADKI